MNECFPLSGTLEQKVRKKEKRRIRKSESQKAFSANAFRRTPGSRSALKAGGEAREDPPKAVGPCKHSGRLNCRNCAACFARLPRKAIPYISKEKAVHIACGGRCLRPVSQLLDACGWRGTNCQRRRHLVKLPEKLRKVRHFFSIRSIPDLCLKRERVLSARDLPASVRKWDILARVGISRRRSWQI